MTNKFKKNKHAQYSMNYIATIATNHGSKLIDNEEIVESLRTVIFNINKTFEIKEINLENGQNYITLIFSAKPTCHLTEYINTIKTQTSKELRKKFPILSSLKDKIWSPNYFISTSSGNVTMEDRQAYIDSQSKIITKTRLHRNNEKLRSSHPA